MEKRSKKEILSGKIKQKKTQKKQLTANPIACIIWLSNSCSVRLSLLGGKVRHLIWKEKSLVRFCPQVGSQGSISGL